MLDGIEPLLVVLDSGPNRLDSDFSSQIHFPTDDNTDTRDSNQDNI